jgi:hypothetical protein
MDRAKRNGRHEWRPTIRIVGTPLIASALVILSSLLIFVMPAFAQTGGQFCVRAFEDRNGNGARDANEPLLTRDVVVTLLDGDSVTVASGVLESSPTAAQGILCFQRLPAGQYSAVVTSADLTATTPTTFSAAVSESGQPVVVDYGAQRAPAVVATAAPAAGAAGITQDTLLRAGVSLGGALFCMLGMAMLGLIIYALFMRRPAPPRAASATTTGSMRPVHIETTELTLDDTGPIRRV